MHKLCNSTYINENENKNLGVGVGKKIKKTDYKLKRKAAVSLEIISLYIPNFRYKFERKALTLFIW